MSKNIRDVAPVIQKIRNFLLGRCHVTALRYKFAMASRSPPPPDLPDGPSHQLNNNYYYTRDARHEVEPPEILTPASKEIESSKHAATGSSRGVLERRPGKVWQWD